MYVEGLGFRGLGFRDLGFRGLGVYESGHCGQSRRDAHRFRG